MRVLTGRFKDHPILFRPQPGLRPTPDRVRKAVIDSLQPGWEGARFLDLYAGTGAMGLEALSAGAASAVFVEADRRRAQCIEKSFCGLDGLAARVVAEDAATALPKIVAQGERFDRVWADPPYEKGLTLWTLEFFKEGQGLHPGAWVVVESYKKETLPEKIARLERRRFSAYGDTGVHYYLLS